MTCETHEPMGVTMGGLIFRLGLLINMLFACYWIQCHPSLNSETRVATKFSALVTEFCGLIFSIFNSVVRAPNSVVLDSVKHATQLTSSPNYGVPQTLPFLYNYGVSEHPRRCSANQAYPCNLFPLVTLLALIMEVRNSLLFPNYGVP